MAEFRVVVPTARFEESARFYAETLGWPLVRSWPDPGRGAIYGTGGETVIELLDVADAPPVTGVFCGIEVPDARAWAATLERAGATVVEPLAEQPWGHRNLGVVDPNGLRLVFFEILSPEPT